MPNHGELLKLLRRIAHETDRIRQSKKSKMWLNTLVTGYDAVMVLKRIDRTLEEVKKHLSNLDGAELTLMKSIKSDAIVLITYEKTINSDAEIV